MSRPRMGMSRCWRLVFAPLLTASYHVDMALKRSNANVVSISIVIEILRSLSGVIEQV